MTWPGADPDAVSWAWTGLAALAAMAAFVVALRIPAHDRAGRTFWWGLTLFVVTLGANKELDLHSQVLARGREVFELHRWLEYRDDALLVLACLTVVAATVVAAPLVVSGLVARYPLPNAGIVLLLGYVVVRTVDLSDIRSGFVPPPWLLVLLEFGGMAAILAGALVHTERTAERWRPRLSRSRR